MRGKIVFALIIFATVCVIAFYKIVSEANENDVKVEFMKSEYKKIKTSNDSLNIRIKVESKKIVEYQKQIDSLTLVKQKIKYVYVNKNKEIANSDAFGVVNMFKSIFAINDIK
jgi:hypothetical protein